MSTKNRGRKKNHIFRTWIKGQAAPIVTPVPSSFARTTVETTMSELDVREGKPKMAVSCAIHHRLASENNTNPFPHSRYHVEVSRSRVAVVDRVCKKTGQWLHCVVYKHNKVEWTRLYDRPGGKAKLLKNWSGDEPVTLSPPRKNKYRPGRKRGKNDGSRSPITYQTKKRGKYGPQKRWCDQYVPVMAV